MTFATYRLDRETLIQPPKRQAPRWLYRLLKKAHAWLDDFANEPVEVSIKTTTIDFSQKFDGIHEHIREIQRTTGMRPKYLFIGRDVYFELSKEVLDRFPFAINYNYPPQRGNELFGLTVVVVPWIDGIFCLPDLDKLTH